MHFLDFTIFIYLDLIGSSLFSFFCHDSVSLGVNGGCRWILIHYLGDWNHMMIS